MPPSIKVTGLAIKDQNSRFTYILRGYHLVMVSLVGCISLTLAWQLVHVGFTLLRALFLLLCCLLTVGLYLKIELCRWLIVILGWLLAGWSMVVLEFRWAPTLLFSVFVVAHGIVYLGSCLKKEFRRSPLARPGTVSKSDLYR